jgi:chemotaxis signal transduction protein
MTGMVRFKSGDGTYVVPLEHALEVRTRASMRSLPDPLPGVEGVVEHDHRVLPVVRALGFGGRQVLLLQVDERALGLLVDEVTGVIEVRDLETGPAPEGQRAPLVAGTIRLGDELAYVLDVGQLADLFAAPDPLVDALVGVQEDQP